MHVCVSQEFPALCIYLKLQLKDAFYQHHMFISVYLNNKCAYVYLIYLWLWCTGVCDGKSVCA